MLNNKIYINKFELFNNFVLKLGVIDLKLFKNFILRCKNFYKKNKKIILKSIIIVLFVILVDFYWPRNIFEIYKSPNIPKNSIGEFIMFEINKDVQMIITYNDGFKIRSVTLTDSTEIYNIIKTLNERKYIPSILPYQKNIDEISETYTIDVKVIGENLMNIALNKDFLYLNIFKVLIPNKYKIIGNELELNFLNKFFLD